MHISDPVVETVRDTLDEVRCHEKEFFHWMKDWTFAANGEIVENPGSNTAAAAKAFFRMATFRTFCDDRILRLVLRFLEVNKQRPDLAQRVRASVYHNAARNETIYDPYPSDGDLSGRLTWLIRPRHAANHVETLTQIRHWRIAAENGEERLYDHAKSLFFFLQNSPLHEPYLRACALDLAAVAITYGDYGDAQTLASWYVGQIRKAPPDALSATEIHRANRVFENAKTYLLFPEPYESFRARFGRVVDKIDQDDSLSPLEQARLLKDAWRCLVRHAVNYRLRSLYTRDDPDIPPEERRTLVTSLSDAITNAETLGDQRHGLDQDTSARALSILLGRHAEADTEYDASARRFLLEASRFPSVVDQPHLQTVWRQITKTMLLVARGIGPSLKDDRQIHLQMAETALDDLIIDITPEKMRHSRNYESMLRAAINACRSTEVEWTSC